MIQTNINYLNGKRNKKEEFEKDIPEFHFSAINLLDVLLYFRVFCFEKLSEK